MSGKKLPNKVASQLVDFISKNYSLGDKIPNEMKLAAMFGVSRTTIREAIKILSSQDIIEVRRGKGTFVIKDIGVLKNPNGIKFVDDQDIVEDLLEMMKILEPEAVVMAMENYTDEDMKMLKKLHDEYSILLSMYRRKDGDVDLCKLYKKDLEFRGFLVQMAKNKMLSKIFPLEVCNFEAWYDDMLEKCLKYQAAIIKHLEEKNEEQLKKIALEYIDDILEVLEKHSCCTA